MSLFSFSSFYSCLLTVAVSLLLPFSKGYADLVYACSDTGVIQIIDTTTNTIVSTIPTSGTPDAIVFNADASVGYVNCNVSSVNQVFVLDPATNVLTPLATGGSGVNNNLAWLTITPNGQFLYLSNAASGGNGSISVIDTLLRTVKATVPLPASLPFGSVFAATINGDFIYVADENGHVYVIETLTNTVVSTIVTGDTNEQVAVTPDGAFVYVSVNDAFIFVIDTSTNTITTTIDLVNNGSGIVMNPSGDFVYVCIQNDPGVEVISTATNSVEATILLSVPTGSTNYLAITPDGQFIYVGTTEDPGVVVIDTASLTQIATVPGSTHNTSLAIIPGSLPPPPTPTSSPTRGTQVANRFLTQTDFVNIISWGTPTNFVPVRYNIYRDAALTDLAGTVSATTFEFEDHNRVRKRVYTYFVIAVNAVGTTATIGSVTVFPIN